MSDAGQTGITWWQTISHAQQTADLFKALYNNKTGKQIVKVISSYDFYKVIL